VHISDFTLSRFTTATNTNTATITTITISTTNTFNFVWMAYIFQEITPGYASHHNSQLSQSKTFRDGCHCHCHYQRWRMPPFMRQCWGLQLGMVGARQCSLGDRKAIWPVQKNLCITLTVKYTFQTRCARGNTICPARLLPPSCTAEQTQRSSTFPHRIHSHTDRCSRLMR